MLACKETAVIHFFALGAAAVIGRRFQAVAKIPPARIWLAGFTTFLFALVLLFTWAGKNWTALTDLLRAIPNFATRAGGQGHEKPFWYYAAFVAFGWSGTAILAVAATGFFRVIQKPASGARFAMAIYALVIFIIYSAIPYKTPWLALNFWLPLAILAGIGVEWLWFAFPQFSARIAIFLLVTAMGFFAAHDTVKWVFKNPADEKNPYAYAHTGEDLLRLPGRLSELSLQNHVANPRIAVVAADAWPLPWYLRKFSRVGFWQPGQETGSADFFITTTDVAGRLAERLKDFRPEFFGARPGVLLVMWSPVATNAATGDLPPRQP
jgi:predicted membrane-bound mannosyltransferase